MSPSFSRACPSFGSIWSAVRYSTIALAKSFFAAYSSARFTWSAADFRAQALATAATLMANETTRTNLSMPFALQKFYPGRTTRRTRFEICGLSDYFSAVEAFVSRGRVAYTCWIFRTKFRDAATSHRRAAGNGKISKYFAGCAGLDLALEARVKSGGDCDPCDNPEYPLRSGPGHGGSRLVGNGTQRVRRVRDLFVVDDEPDLHDAPERVHVGAR